MKTVLVCSDNLFLRPRLERSLRDAGWEVRWGRAAGDVASGRGEFDAVLVDLGSSRIDWRGIVAAAREPGGRELPVVAFGPHVDRESFRAAAQAGCVRVVPNGRIAHDAGEVLRDLVVHE